MKRIFYLLIFTILSSCTTEEKKVEKLNSGFVSLPLRPIKENSFNRRRYYNLDSLELNRLKLIDTTFFKEYFLGLPINNLSNSNIEFDPYSRYYFFDYKDIADLVLFTIIHDDEVGYENLYHFTYHRTKNRLLAVDYLAATGGDDGHGNYDILNYNKNGDTLLRISSSQFWEDINNGSSIQYDSVIYKILFSKNGTKYIKQDSLSRMDTVWSKN